MRDILRLFRKRQRSDSAQSSYPERLVRVGCPAHNCGGRCLLGAHVVEDAAGRRVITRLDTDDRPDTVASPQLRA